VRAGERSTTRKSRAVTTRGLIRGRLGGFDEFDLVVQAIVVVPMLLTVNVVPNTYEHGLAFQVGLIVELDVEGKPIVAIMGVLATNVVAVHGDDFGHGPPMIERKTGSHMLVKREISHRDGANQTLLVS
jgi:hypothetical protein